MKLPTAVPFLLACTSQGARAARYHNPVLPGFHPDPSCIYVEEFDQTFFCATSSFSVFPGIPIHASKDLVHWKLASNALNRGSQLPDFISTPTGQDGIFAPTLRFHNGTFYLISTWVSIGSYVDFKMDNVIFTSTDPFNSSSWSDPTHFDFVGYDPSLFWDVDGTTYLIAAQATSTGTTIALAPFDPLIGEYLGSTTYPYNGTGVGTPEGPHLYHNPSTGFYYILIAEGGTAENHRGSIARSSSVTGPYESFPDNPIIHAASNTSFIQSVGHADLFEDGSGQWWGVALAQRAGTTGVNTVPMGRETVLFPVRWDIDGWVRVEGNGVQGVMQAPLPVAARMDVPGEGAWHDVPDVVDFEDGTQLPKHFVHVRLPDEAAYVVSPPRRDGELQLVASERNLSSKGGGNLTEGTTFVGRRQVDTLFTFSVDIEFEPRSLGDEAGVTVYLDEARHVDLGIVLATEGDYLVELKAFSSNAKATAPQIVTAALRDPVGRIRLVIQATNTTHYTFSAGSVVESGIASVDTQVVGFAEVSLVSGGFTGTLVGAYATTHGAAENHTANAYVSRWRYQGQGQEVDEGVIV
ncbi:Glycoside hydrolase family 43 [Diaporthe amygdali]|uniref:Glycoside hydrolase family 43 n=1 Tax=Phomopsis amygdali TaxID=1214568 RepID=UPI0022FF223E|nr:Glycoside hydrolase family 43 [Diaporthe amygdali]KAJ0116970.1 Glycoside hydrolase family 43 [Diaporthe amygdali]